MQFFKQAAFVFFLAVLSQSAQGIHIKQKIATRLNNYNNQQQQWGFLKNIVNIDKFFAGPDSEIQSTSITSLNQQKRRGTTKLAQLKNDDELLASVDITDQEPDASAVTQTETEQAAETAELEKAIDAETETTQTETNENQNNEQTKQEEKPAKEESASISLSQSSTEKEQLQEATRNEGLSIKADESTQQVDLEIDEEGAAQLATEKGSKTIQNESEFKQLQAQLQKARSKAENKLGEGGFKIDLKDPTAFKNKINVVIMPDPQDESQVAQEVFDTSDQKQAKTASEAISMVQQSDTGSIVVNDDSPGKELILQNNNSDSSKYNSYITAGYSIRNNLAQKMAPGDKSFHTVNYQPNNQVNGYRTFPSREAGEKHFEELGDQPKLLISGETGDVLMANGTQQQTDQCLGNFFTQRYNGKYYGQN